MDTTTRTALRLFLLAPVAAGAIALGGAAGTAHAEEGFPLQAEIAHPDPEPQPTGPDKIALPKPKDPTPTGPDTIAVPKPKDPKPTGPGDLTNPEPTDPKPTGPGDLTDGDGGDQPGPQIPGDKTGPSQGGDTPDDAPADVPADTGDTGDRAPQAKGADESIDNGTDAVVVPTRIDAGAGPAAGPAAGQMDGQMDLAWLLAGGGLVTAAGAFAARRRMAGAR